MEPNHGDDENDETACLLKSTANAERLLGSLDEVRRGRTFARPHIHDDEVPPGGDG
jgi:PHD/YefM family antitoxin component YafN of YafNO toxin-antitoxin module